VERASVVAKATPAKPKAEGSGETPEPKVFVWKPKDGSKPIELPHYDTVRPKDKTMWFEYQLNKRSYSLVAQIQFAMDCAEIPEETQDRVFGLPDDEQLDLVNGWVKTVTGGATLGES
jgi:hypothetical protein